MVGSQVSELPGLRSETWGTRFFGLSGLFGLPGLRSETHSTSLRAGCGHPEVSCGGRGGAGRMQGSLHYAFAKSANALVERTGLCNRETGLGFAETGLGF